MNKQQRLQDILKGKSSYAVVKYNGVEELLWITCHKGFNDGKDWYLEAPNQLREFHGYDLNNMEDLEFIDSYGMMIYDNKVWEIDSPQVSPFLPNDFEIELVDEQYALVYLISRDKN